MSSQNITELVVSLVGRPNVGKSTLFNVLTRSRDALVADYPGLTRDRQYGRFKFKSSDIIIIDTGGLSGESEELDSHMEKQTRLAVDESDIILFMVDARDGLTPADEVIADSLRRTGKEVKLIVNKTDGLDVRTVASEFFSLGLGTPVPIAASQNRGIQAMLSDVLQSYDLREDSAREDEIAEELDDDEEQDKSIKVAIIGRPNVGKSTLVNRFLGEERVVVFDMPGTTRDSVSIPFERDGKKYTFIDTAGIRRKRSVHEAIEKFSIIKSMQAIERANVVIMMIDARTEIADQDLHLIGYVLEAGRALILTINKWDGMDDYQKELIHKGIDKQLPFVRFAETFFISALHGSGVGKLYEAIDRAYASATKKYSTSDLTRLLEKAVQSHQPPLVNGRRIKLRYAHQGGMNPPRIIIHGNQVSKVPSVYKRYLTNFFRKELSSVGTPIMIEFKGSNSNPYKDSSRKKSAYKRK
ncbi:MAG: ribosome biogenesis GTPase Der [Gammaproteobacteria bacterium]|nr:ribosome biogenesis GTPase Der [Gammaproteobacteria bacterium]NNJ49275.1 ribosome biogenesis GTPase Der [Gammaproteobacteria bacterium]